MCKKLLALVIVFFVAKTIYSQPFRNEWIDYSKTYYKFKLGPFGFDEVGAPIPGGVVRITQATLVSAGLGSVPAEQFQLWHDGKQIAIYVSKNSGILSSSDFIEFWGEIANGKDDEALYQDSSYQLSQRWSLETDSSTYFLTVNSVGTNKRVKEVINNTNTTLKPEQNFMYTVGRYFRYGINEGYGIALEKTLYSSSYENGEGWSSRPVHPAACGCGQLLLPQTFDQLYLDKNGGSLTAGINMMGNAPNPRDIKISMNGTDLTQVELGYFQTIKLQIPNIANNLVTEDVATFFIENLSPVDDDEMRVAQVELTYPRKFDFGNKSAFEFYLPASQKGRYLKITDFNTNGVAPVLFDIENNKRYVGDISVNDTIQFVLAKSTSAYHLVLVQGNGISAVDISSLEQKQFIDYSQAINQGDFLIITNPSLLAAAPFDYIQQYNEYRKSERGGSYNSIIVDIHQLEDQYAYGVKFHPLAVKNFLRFARNKFSNAPLYAFIIGKGVSYSSYRPYGEDALLDELNFVPTFGSPGSDNLLSSNSYLPVPATPIGRLSVVSNAEIGDYFAKVKQYELAQQARGFTIEKKGWMKNVLQLTGANDPTIGSQLDNIASKYKRIISDSSFGGNVTNYSKTADPGGYPKAIVDFKNTFNNGASLLEYFGHSSSTSLDFSLGDPSIYNNVGKYPFFIVNGCLAGNIFDYDGSRLTNRSTVSERFVLEPQKGAIAYLSTSSYGVLEYLDLYTKEIYKAITQTQYGKGLGDIISEGIGKALNVTGNSDFYGKIHAEQFTLHGDPSLKMNTFDKPDYVVDSKFAEASPEFISVADKSYFVKIRIYNIGKFSKDSVHFSLYRRTAGNDSTLLFSKTLKAIRSSDSVIVKLPIVQDKDTGLIKMFAIIDDNNKVDELSERNNKARISVYISSQEIRPIYPYNYSIVTTPKVDLSASTANPFDTLKQYVLEMDTTALFNSSSKISLQKNSIGGVVQFLNVSLPLNNTVYYWRIAPAGSNPHWNMFSFLHDNSSFKGFSQSHYFQETQSDFNRVQLDSSRSFSFTDKLTNLFVLQSIYPTSGTEDAHFSVSVNGSYVAQSACIGYSIMFNVFDPLTFKPIPNTTNPYGAAEVCAPSRLNNFEFHTTDPDSRKNAMDFLDNFVPDGYYVVARKIYDDWADNGHWASEWASDTALYGSNNSLYSRLKDQGLDIDSFYFPRTFVFVFKKNDSAHFSPISVLSQGVYDRITLSENLTSRDTVGTVASPLFGPGKAWKNVVWNGADLNTNNVTSLNVYGVTARGKDTLYYTLDKSQATADISGINAGRFPYLKLEMKTQDSITAIPYQLNNWSVEYTPVPEGGVAPNLGYSIPKKLTFDHDINIAFDTLQGYITFKNVSEQNFDSLKVKMVLYDESNIPYTFVLPTLKPLLAGDTMHIPILANVTALPQGNYNLFLQVNPGKSLEEQFVFNNLLYKYIFIKRSISGRLPEFAAEKMESNVLTKWKVQEETNFDHYEVEYSKDGKQFAFAANIKLNAGDNILKMYSFIHNNPVNGNNYYRLKTIYKDGTADYSAVRIVNFSENISLKVYPNPFKNVLNISAGKNVKATVRIFELSGKQVLQQTFNGSTSLNVSSFSTGNYIVQVDDGNTIRSFKIQKQSN